MFKHNMPVEDIADISELSVEEVNDILKKAMVIHWLWHKLPETSEAVMLPPVSLLSVLSAL